MHTLPFLQQRRGLLLGGGARIRTCSQHGQNTRACTGERLCGCWVALPLMEPV